MPEVEAGAGGAVAAPGGLRRVVRAGLLVGLALAAFVLTGRVVDSQVPLRVPLLGVKWAYFLAHRDEYTTVYLGTSLVRHHVVPEVVDAQLRAAGIPERSFNLGMAHMTYPEARQLLARLVALRPARLRRVVLDASLFLDTRHSNDLTPRHLWWHTPGETARILARIAEFDAPVGRRLERARVETQALLIAETAAGRVAEAFRAAWDPGFRGHDESDDPVTMAGYRDLDTMRSRSALRQRRRMQRDPGYFERQVEQRRRNQRARKLPRAEREALDELVGQVARAGWQPVVLETASTKPRFEFSPTVRKQAIVLSLNDPLKYPELYQAAAWHDYNHMNNAGARAASLLLGDAFAAALAGPAGPRPGLRRGDGPGPR